MRCVNSVRWDCDPINFSIDFQLNHFGLFWWCVVDENYALTKKNQQHANACGVTLLAAFITLGDCRLLKLSIESNFRVNQLYNETRDDNHEIHQL